MRARLVVLLVVIGLAFTGVLVRLTVVQGFSARRYEVFGESQRMHTIALPAERGAILDRNRGELAVSTRRATVWADATVVADPVAAARALAPVLAADEAELREKLSSEASLVYLARKVDDRVAEGVIRLNVEGIQLLDEPKRIVRFGDLAVTGLGAICVDEEVLFGLG